ncbi:MAG: TRAP transporter substrate-binding protein DctP, partial [Desulfotignum sp.]
MKKSGVKQSVLVTGVAVLITFALGCFLPAFADTVKFGHVAPPFHGQAKGVDAFADYVKEKTNGEIEIATFPAGQLGGERSMAEQVQAGTLQIAALTTAVLQNFVPQCAILDMPFIFPDRQTAYA